MSPKNDKEKRWRLLADVPLQGGLCLRIVAYWIICQAALVGTMMAFSLLDTAGAHNASLWQFVTPALTISSFLLPLILLDAIKFTNRFAGPLVNFRREFKHLVDGDVTRSLAFRDGDQYRDLESDFNRMLENMKNASVDSDAVQHDQSSSSDNARNELVAKS